MSNVRDQISVIPYPNYFQRYTRKDAIKNIVIHETGGSTVLGAIETMKKRKIGAHFIIAPSGEIIPCVDPLLRTDHAKGMNNKGIGIEIVNPYAPKNIKEIKYSEHEIGPSYTLIPAQWWTWCPDKNNKFYVVPFKEQLFSLVKLVEYLVDEYCVPYKFPTEKIRKKQPAENILHGIVAHRDFGTHSDGRYPLEFVINNKHAKDLGVLYAI